MFGSTNDLRYPQVAWPIKCTIIEVPFHSTTIKVLFQYKCLIIIYAHSKYTVQPFHPTIPLQKHERNPFSATLRMLGIHY